MKRMARTAAVGVLSLLAAGCWPVPGQNADRTAYNDLETGLTTETVGDLQELWRWSGSAEMTGPVVSPGGLHLVLGCGATTLDPATGTVRWNARLVDDLSPCGGGVWMVDSSEPYTTPDGERVIASVGVSRVRVPAYLEARWTTRVLDVATGAEEGSAPVGFVVGARGEQLVGVREGSIGPFVAGRMVELATLDAERPWRSLMVSVQGGGFLAPAHVTLGPDMLYHAGYGILATVPGDGTQGEAVRAYTRDGPLEWCGPVTFPAPVGGSYDLECPRWVTPTDGQPTAPVRSPDGSVLYVRTTAGTLYALDAVTGAVRWTATGLGQAGPPALADGTLYVPTGDGRILAFDGRGCGAPTCEPRRSYATGTTAAVAAPAVAGDVLYATAGGSVHGFAAEGCDSTPCRPLWSAPGSGAPVVSGGRVYVRSAAGTDLVAYGLP